MDNSKIISRFFIVKRLLKNIKVLSDNNIEFEHVDNVVNKLNKEELKHIHIKSKLDIKRMFNTSGIKYRELGIKDKFDKMTEDEVFKLLASDGMLVKRPILVSGKKVLIGFKLKEWEEVL